MYLKVYKYADDFIQLSPTLLYLVLLVVHTPVSNWSIQASYLRGDSNCSWVTVCALGPKSGLEQLVVMLEEDIHARHQSLVRNCGSASLVKCLY